MGNCQIYTPVNKVLKQGINGGIKQKISGFCSPPKCEKWAFFFSIYLELSVQECAVPW